MRKKIFVIILVSLLSILLIGCGKKEQEKKYSIVVTNFPCYDFARAIVKDSDEFDIKMLLKPGSEIHDFDPTPQDIIDIENSDLFIYVGGESDTWVDSVISDLDKDKTKAIKLMDFVPLFVEETKEGMEVDEYEEDHEEYDEHIWTSPKNAIKIIEGLSEIISQIDKENSDLYIENAKNYTEELKRIDIEIREIVNNSNNKLLIFGDRFPFRYFVEEYGLNYYAAFNGCSEASEASAKTIAFLVDKIKTNNINYILKIELSSEKIAIALKNETNKEIRTLNSAHNISQKDFDSGITYVDIMKDNIKVLKEVLN
ncbi:MAG: zinc ABC transporter substrate-binding protein [Bacilli bacterium]|nr:zinc ABC transporter substrate-binding protein [Bacilli bacterium]